MKRLLTLLFLLGSLLVHAQGPPNSITFPAKGDTANRVKDRWTVQIMGRTPYWVPPLNSPYHAFPVTGELNGSLGEVGVSGPIQFDQFYDPTLSGSPADSVRGMGVDLEKELVRIRDAIATYAPVAGKDGAQGPQGIPGVAGKDGKDGAPGAQGLQGLPSSQGIPGVDGKDGQPGVQGVQGIPGVAGAAGKDGKDGAPGAQGVQGVPGSQGLQGLQGVPGNDGQPGATGATGAAGAAGVSAFTRTTSVYSNPALGSTITVNVGTTAWMSLGQSIYIFNVGTGSQAGVYRVANINSLTAVALTYTDDLPSYTGSVVGGSYVTPTGVRGATGTAGTQITGSSSLSITALTATGNVKAGSITLSDGLPITDFGPGNGIDYGGNGRFHLKNAVVAQLVQTTLRGFDGYDENINNQVLSHTGSIFKWIVAAPTATTGTSTSTSSGTAAAPTSNSGIAAVFRDSVLINADSTKMRFAASGTTTTNISTVAQLRAFLTSTQTNVRGVLANGVYDDGAAFEQTGTWTNVSLEAANFRQAILQNSGGNLVWIDQGGNSRRRVRLKDFVLRTGAPDQNSLAIYHHNELPDWDGLEWDGLEIYHTNPTQGKTNGFTIVPYSEGSSQGKILRNVFMHNCYIHDIPRANEFLSHGFDADRILNVVVTNNRFERMGVNDDFGAPLSYSGRIKYIYTAKNTLTGFKYAGIEHVANRFAIDASNVLSNTAATGGVGIAMSDNNLNLSRYLWLENNSVNVMSRPFYAYGVKNVFVTGGTYTGRLGIDGTPKSSIFKDFTATVWAKAGQTVYNYVWQFDGDSNDNDVSNVTASSANTQANSPGGPTAYTIHLQGGTYNNRFNNVTTILGKDPNGNWGGSGAIVNDGQNTNVITNNTVSRVN